jgi:3-oxoacyl-[acyl-carrier protein] reductase
MDLQLKGRCYLVTGASRGLGYAVAAALVDEGARVTISARHGDKLAVAATNLGANAAWFAADNADAAAATDAVAAAVRHGGSGKLDGLLISVGGPMPSSVLDTSDSTWRAEFESLFVGALRLARAAVAVMDAGSAIGFVLSSSVRNPIPGLAASNAIRPALAMTAKTLADELGPRGIRVVGFLPGQILTERTQELQELHPPGNADSTIPLGRLGDPDEFGRVAAFILSPAASYVTGCVIPVDGGLIRAL